MVKPVAPVNASVASVRISPYYDSIRRGESFEASPAERRAGTKAWRSYSKGGVKKKYAPSQKKKTPRELFEAFVLSANGAQALNQGNLNANYTKENKKRQQQVEGAGGGVGYEHFEVVEWRTNPARRADQQLVLVQKKARFSSRKKDDRPASARAEDVRRYRAKLVEARETIKGLSIGVMAKAVNSPLEMMSSATGIQGLHAEDIQRLCSDALLKLIQPTTKMMLAVAVPQPDKAQAVIDFDNVVSFSAKQNEQGVAPRPAFQIAIERADSRTLSSVAFSLSMPWSEHRAPAVLAY